MFNKSRSDEDSDEVFTNNPIVITRDQSVSNTFTVYFNKVLDNPADYTSLLGLLAQATEEDIFVYRIMACPGGRVDIALPIYNATKNTAANTIAVLESHSASAASMLFLSCDQYIVQPNSTLMVHGASYGYFGHMSSVKSQVNFNNTFLEKLFREVYEGFMTEDEINKCIYNEVDMYMSDEEIVTRLKAMSEFNKQKLEKASVVEKKPSRKPRGKE